MARSTPVNTARATTSNVERRLVREDLGATRARLLRHTALAGALAALMSFTPVPAERAYAQSTWNNNPSGSWGTATEWTPNGAPNAVDAVVNFNALDGVSLGVGLAGGPFTVGVLNINNAVGGGFGFQVGTLVMNASALAQINVSTSNFTADFFNGGLLQLQSDTIVNTIGAASTFEVATSISGGGNIDKQGLGTLILGAANVHTGGVTIRDGRVDISNGGALGSGSATLAGGTLRATQTIALGNQLNINDNTIGAIAASTGETLTWTAANLFYGANSTLRFGAASDAGTVVLGVAGGGAIVGGGSTVVVVDNGVLRMGESFAANSAFANVGSFSVASGATFDINGFPTSVANLDGAGTVTNNGVAGAQIFVTSTADSTFSGVLQDGASQLGLNKQGAARLTLNGASTYTGTTDVIAGTLAIGPTGSLVGAGGIHTLLTVSGGATLEVANGGLVQVNSLDVDPNGSLLNNGTIQGFGASINIAGAAVSNVKLNDATDINVLAGGSLSAQGEVSAPLVTNSNVFTVTGALTGLGTGPHLAAITNFNNLAGGALAVNANFSGVDNLTNTSALANAVTVSAGATLAVTNIVANNAGTWTNNGATTATQIDNAAFFNTNAATSKLNATLSINNLAGGVMQAAGELSAPLVTNANVFTVTGALTGVGTGPNVGTITNFNNLAGGALTLNANVSGVDNVTNTSALANAVTVSAGATLAVTNIVANNAGTWTNNGATTATQIDNAAFFNTNTATSKLNATASINNLAGGVMQAAGELSAPLVTNANVFTVTGALTGVGTGPYVGTITNFNNLAGGALTLNANVSGVDNVTNTSALANAVTVSAGATLAVNNIVANNAGTWTNNGATTATQIDNAAFFNTNAATSKLNATASINNLAGGVMQAAGELSAPLVTNANVFTVTGALTGVGTGPYVGTITNFNNLAGGALTLNANVSGVDNVTNTSALANAVTVSAGATLAVNNIVANNAGTWTNNGATTATQIDNAAFFNTNAATSKLNATASINNLAGGVMQAAGELSAPLVTNANVFTVTGALTGVGTGPNVGAIANFNNLAGGALAVNAAFSGLVNLTNTSALANAVNVAAAGSIAATGTIANNAGTFTNAGIVTAPVISNLATFTSTGAVGASTSFTNTGTASFSGQLNTPLVNNSGAFNVTGALAAFGGPGVGIARFEQTATGVFDLGANAVTIGSLNGAGIVQNGGVLTTGDDGTTTLFSGAINGATGLTKTGAGMMTLSGVSTYTGATTINGGDLRVTGSLGVTPVAVNNTGTLSGTGIIGGTVTLNAGGTLAPGAGGPGAITLAGLTVNAGSTIQADFATPGFVAGATNDIITVTGTATFAGAATVNVNAPSAGYYRLINAGAVAPGFVAPTVTGSGGLVGTALANVPGQVNILLAGAGVPIQFWDGSDLVGEPALGVDNVDGGTGTWNATNTNWTDAPGRSGVNDAWRSGVGVFMGAAGTVTVVGTQAFDTLQFSTNGYLLTPGAGGQLALNGAGTINTDANVASRIDAPLVNGTASALTKVGAGTLQLGGASTFTGGANVNAGLLQVLASGSLASQVAVASAARLLNEGAINAGVTVAQGAAATNAGAIAGLVANSGAFSSTGALLGGLTNTTTGVVDLGGVLNGPVSNANLFTVNGVTTGTAAIVNQTTGSFAVASGASLTSASFDNRGALSLLGAFSPTSFVNSGATNALGAIGGGAGSTVNSGRINVNTTGASISLGALTNTGVIDMIGGGTTNVVRALGVYNGGGVVRADVSVQTGASDLLALGGGAASNTTLVLNRLGANQVHPDAAIVTNAGAANFAVAGALTPTTQSPFAIAGAQLVQDDGFLQQWFGQSAPGRWVLRADVNTNSIASAAGAVAGVMSSITTAFAEPASAFISRPQDDSPNKFSLGVWGRTRDGQFRIESASAIGGLGAGAANRIVDAKARASFVGFQLGVDAGLYNINNSGWSANLGVHGGYIDGVSKTADARLDVKEPFYGVYGALTNGQFAFDVMFRKDEYDLKLSPNDRRIFPASFDGKFKGDGWSLLANVQYRFTIGENVWFEPSATYIYSRVGLGDVQTVAGPIKWSDIDSSTLRVGGQLRWLHQFGDSLYVSPAVSLSLWHEFAGKSRAVLVSPAGTLPISTDRVGTYAQASGSLTFIPAKLPNLTGFVRGDVRFGEKINGWAVNAGVRYQF